MSDAPATWTVRLTDAAERDFKNILAWTLEQFGEQQAQVYAETLSAALTDLAAGPAQMGVRARNDIARGLLTLYAARHGRRARHFVMFRIADRRAHILDVLRLLHDAMDFPRHLPPFVEGE